MYSAYAWLSFRIPEYFPDGDLAHELAREASDRVDAMLQAQNTAIRRRRAGKGR
jgi:ATP-dependent RNA helicase SUPV3L1/SUV3